MKKTALAIITISLIGFMLAGCGAVKVVGGPIPTTALKDGVYEGSASSFPVKVKVDVTVKDNRIAAIDLVKHRNGRGESAETLIPERIIAAQSTKVDVVSGATYSSNAIMNAVEDALRKAE